MGPTASGKTDLAVALTQQLPCEIISVDSAMVYKGMDIGTAKPSPEILSLAPHHLIDIRDPSEPYSAADFCKDAQALIDAILQRGRIPLLVGGTMLYFKALQQGLSNLPVADPKIRAGLEAEAKQQGWGALHKRLQQIDPIAAARIHPHDPQRLQRALEVYEITGQTLTDLSGKPSVGGRSYAWLNLALIPSDREILRERIRLRFLQMLDQGFIEEVRGFYNRGDLQPNLPSMRAVGYRQVWQHLAGELTEAEMVEKATIASQQLAKRQLTWLRSWPKLYLFEATYPDLVEEVLKYLSNHGIIFKI